VVCVLSQEADSNASFHACRGEAASETRHERGELPPCVRPTAAPCREPVAVCECSAWRTTSGIWRCPSLPERALLAMMALCCWLCVFLPEVKNLLQDTQPIINTTRGGRRARHLYNLGRRKHRVSSHLLFCKKLTTLHTRHGLGHAPHPQRVNNLLHTPISPRTIASCLIFFCKKSYTTVQREPHIRAIIRARNV